MNEETRFVASTTAFGVLTLAHAAATWGPLATLRFAAVAVGVAFVAEVVCVRLGLLRHHTRPRISGVPLVALLGWIGAIYLCYRVATLVVTAPLAPLLAAGIATAANVFTDPRGVDAGLWSYPDARVSTPRYRGVPWWNFLGWFVLTATVAALGAP